MKYLYYPKIIQITPQMVHGITAKPIEQYMNDIYIATSICMQGARPSMEDTHIIKLSLQNHPEYAVFGIFDGHSDKFVAEYLKENMIGYLDSLENFDDISLSNKMIEIDQDIISKIAEINIINIKQNKMQINAGSTCCMVLIKDDDVTAINIGDSRSYIIKQDKFIQMTKDHKPNLDSERKRIKTAGGLVCLRDVYRINGNLAVSRAFGDIEYKNNKSLSIDAQLVIAKPDITHFKIEKK